MSRAAQSDMERAIYWRRRRVDAVRLVPFLGTLLFLFPLLFGLNDDSGVSSARVGLYLFAVWAVLIGLSAWLSRRLEPIPGEHEDANDGAREEGWL